MYPTISGPSLSCHVIHCRHMDVVVQILVWLRGLDPWLLIVTVSGALFFLFLFSSRGARFIEMIKRVKNARLGKSTTEKPLIDEGVGFIEEETEELEVEEQEEESPLKRLDLLENPPEAEEETKGRPCSMSRIMEKLAIVKDELAFGNRQVLEDFDSITDPNAIEEAEARLVNEPDNLGLIDWLAFMYYTNDHVEKALDCYKDLVERSPDTAEHYFYMGNTYFKISLLPEAIFCWKHLERLNAPRKMIERANASIESAEALLNQWASVGMKASISDSFIAQLAGINDLQSSSPGAEAATPTQSDVSPPEQAVVPTTVDELAALRSLQDEEETALQDAFNALFSSPSSSRLLDEKSPLEPLPPSQHLWEGEHLQELATRSEIPLARFALRRLLDDRHALETVTSSGPLSALLSPETDLDIRCLAAACLARAPQANEVPVDKLFAALHGEGDGPGRLAASLLYLAPRRALEVLPERWARKERRKEWQRALKDLTILGRPKAKKGIVALFCALAESASDVQAVIELICDNPAPEDLIPISAAISPFCLASEAPGDDVFLSLHRLTRTVALRQHLSTFGSGVAPMKSLLRACAEYYSGSSGPASSFLASTLVECVNVGNLSKLFKLLREEAIGNLDQSIPGLSQSKGSDAIKKLVHPWLLASMGLLTGLARHWPRGKHQVPAARSLVLLGLCCYAHVSYGTKHLLRLKEKLQKADEVRALLIGNRDDIALTQFSGLTQGADILADVLVKKGNKMPAPARARLYFLLRSYGAPAVLMSALKELATPPNDQLECFPSPKECARDLLKANLPTLARIAPLVLDLDVAELVGPTLLCLSSYAEKNLLNILEPRLQRLAYGHPTALGELLYSTMPLELAPQIKAIVDGAKEDEPLRERLQAYLAVAAAVVPPKAAPSPKPSPAVSPALAPAPITAAVEPVRTQPAPSTTGEEKKKRWQEATTPTTYRWG